MSDVLRARTLHDAVEECVVVRAAIERVIILHQTAYFGPRFDCAPNVLSRGLEVTIQFAGKPALLEAMARRMSVAHLISLRRVRTDMQGMGG